MTPNDLAIQIDHIMQTIKTLDAEIAVIHNAQDYQYECIKEIRSFLDSRFIVDVDWLEEDGGGA